MTRRTDSGDGIPSTLSTRTAKENVDPVDPGEVLAGLRTLDVSTWNYEAQGESVRHMGPMAEQFHDVFGLGAERERIANVDADGVAFAAVQGLADRVDDQAATIEAQRDTILDQEATITEQRIRLDDQSDALAAQRETIAEQRARLDDLEARVAALEGEDAEAPADD